MSVWFCIPSKRPVAEAQACIDMWRARGYKTAIWRDAGDEPVECDLLLRGEYPGYAGAVNALVKEVLASDPSCGWTVTGGDDTEPDGIKDANQIASELIVHFSGTFGVCQPTGDRWAGGSIDRICGSPWMGREFCQRVNGGNGPLWADYAHMFGDDELQQVAQRLGVLWQRRDLTHKHNHFMRSGDAVVANKPPTFLAEANSPAHWQKYQTLFQNRKAAGFPGHEPLPVALPVGGGIYGAGIRGGVLQA